MNRHILIISMNALSETKNNGKTIETFFNLYPKKLLSHIYFILEDEDLNFCNSSLRFCIFDAYDNLFRFKKKKYGIILNSENNHTDNFSPSKYFKFVIKKFEKTKLKSKNMISTNDDYSKIRAYLISEIVWFSSKWYYEQIKEFVEVNKPEVIFYQANKYSFLHRIVLRISQEYNLPIIVQCTDDYTIPHIKESKLNRLLTKNYLRDFKKLMKTASVLLAISDLMAEEYSEKYFYGKAYVMSNFIERHNEDVDYIKKRKRRILYAGNLGLNRWKVICSVGKSLDYLNNNFENYDYELSVYSGDSLDKDMTKNFSHIKSLKYYGFVDTQTLNQKVLECDYLLHCESFDNTNRRVTRLSISTKIGEYICSNRCILAVGPQDIASMKYLAENKLAKVINKDDVETISRELKEFFCNPKNSIEIVENEKDEMNKRYNKNYLIKILNEILKNLEIC